MKLNETKWIAAYKKAVADTKRQPSSGTVCAIATVRYIRDEMLEQVKGSASEADDKVIIEDYFNGEDGLLAAVSGGQKLQGFASNASAAAKAAGFEASALPGMSGLVE